jgi:hypothetical protein
MASQRHSREDHKVIKDHNVGDQKVIGDHNVGHHKVTISAKISNVIPVSTATSFREGDCVVIVGPGSGFLWFNRNKR